MNNYEYYLGGSLPIHATTYVTRGADDDLYQGCLNGDFCYVLNSRQMGKSSLRVRIMQRLQQDNIACASIDLTGIGTNEITAEQWYASIIDSILTSLNLDDDFEIDEWWSEHLKFSNVRRFSKFIGEVLLPSISQNIVIFVDEIDSTLSLPFNIDDFFAVIRDCYNKRADNYDYQRLTFVMIGVATPADLIKEKKRTPFNIGIPIKLTGFRLAEVEPLAQGLVEKTVNINKLMEAVLDWTGGQPFLTQKVCKFISNSSEIVPDGLEKEWVADLVRQRIIDNWQVYDDPEHLKTIRDRLLVNEKRASRLLGLYQQVLNSGGVVADDSPEQMELRLTGLVVKQEGELQVANRIYQEVFNLQWVERELGKLRPYSEAFTAWEESGCKDESRLLRGKALADALAWAVDKSLSSQDYQFLTASQEVEKQAIELEKLEAQVKLDAQLKANQILDEAKREANKAKRKAEKRLRISFGVLIPSFMAAIFTGVGVWRGNLKVAEAEAVRQSITSKILSNSGKDFEAILQALRAAKKLPRPNLIFQPLVERKMQITETLSQVIYEYNKPYRESNRFQRHEDEVIGVSFSPDGKTIASASKDGTVKLWSSNGKLLYNLSGHNSSVWSVAFNPDGDTIATASADRTVKLWERTGKLLHTLTGHKDSVEGVAFSPDGKTIATASRDQTVKLWSDNGQLLHTLTGHKHWVISIAFSSDGKTIATASRDQTVKLWSDNGQLLHTLSGHNGSVWSVAFSPDGDTIATASSDNTVKLWSTTGKLLHSLIDHKDSVEGVAFSPDGDTIATASRDQTVKLWNYNGDLLYTLNGHEGYVWGLAFNPDGKTIATAGKDGIVKVWSSNGQLFHTLSGHKDSVEGMAFNPDGKTIATAGKDSIVKVWSGNGKLLYTFIGHRGYIWDVAFSPDGKTIATASGDKTVKLWSPQGKLLHILTGHKSSVLSVAFSPDGETIATTSGDKTVKLWSAQGKLLHTLTGHESLVLGVAFSPDGKTIATASYDKTVKLWSAQGKLLHTLTGHKNWVQDVVLSPDNETIASASSDGTVKLWSRQGKLLHTLIGHESSVLGVAFSPDGKTVATASVDRTVKLWSRQGKLLHTLVGHESSVLSVAFSPDGKTIATASADRTVKLWRNLEGFNHLHQWACNWMRDYLENNPTVSESDRYLCNGVGGKVQK